MCPELTRAAVPAFTPIGDWDCERMILAHHRATGLRAVIVIDNTQLGPALGGIRLRRYESEDAAIADCRRLARAMTLKNTIAQTGFGGGKAVIAWDDEGPSEDSTQRRPDALRAFGQLVRELDGRYIPASDVGTGTEDLAVLRAEGIDVRGGDSDTSVSTAVGVHAAIRAAARHVGLTSRQDTLAGVSVCIQGAGKVGAKLARLLHAAGARIAICDLDGERAARVAHELGAQAIDPRHALASDCDVFAPCAIGGLISETLVPQLRCRIVAGAANNVLADPATAGALAARGIVLVPDFLASAGGVIQVRAIRDEWGAGRLRERLRAIGDTVTDTLAQAERTGHTPTEVAEAIAAARLGARHTPSDRATQPGPHVRPAGANQLAWSIDHATHHATPPHSNP